MSSGERFTLYMYTCQPTGKRYIGTTNDVERRRKEHARGRGRAYAFGNAIKKYGIAAFDFRVLAIFDDVDAAAYHEQEAIKAFKTLSPDGYNLMVGAPRTLYHGVHTPETIAKIQAKTTQIRPEINAKISRALKGRVMSPEWRARIGEKSKGRYFSPETRAKLSEANKKRKITEETRARLIAAQQNRKPITEETRVRLSIAQRARFARERRVDGQLELPLFGLDARTLAAISADWTPA